MRDGEPQCLSGAQDSALYNLTKFYQRVEGGSGAAEAKVTRSGRVLEMGSMGSQQSVTLF
jgi:hypothetical protein